MKLLSCFLGLAIYATFADCDPLLSGQIKKHEQVSVKIMNRKCVINEQKPSYYENNIGVLIAVGSAFPELSVDHVSWYLWDIHYIDL